MSLESTFESLRHALTGLQETVSALHVTIAEDKPVHGSSVLVDKLDNLVIELLSTLEEADVHVAEALRGRKLAQLEQARRALCEAHSLINRFTAQYMGEVSTYDQIARLLAMGRERGREWREWSLEVKTAIERCTRPAKATADALLECWGDLVQRSASLHATHIGQQITLREDQLELTENRHITDCDIWRQAGDSAIRGVPASQGHTILNAESFKDQNLNMTGWR